MHTEDRQSSRRRRSARRAALGVLARAYPGRTSLLALLSLLGGALPAAFALLVGRLVGLVPAAVEDGFDSADGRRTVTTLVLIGAVLAAQEIVGAVKSLAVTDLYRRFDEYLLARVMDTTLRAPGLDLFEDPELAAHTDKAARIVRFGPGELISGLSYRWASQVQGIAAAVLVASVWPVAAGVLLVLWVVTGRYLRADFYRANPFWAEPLRRAMYLKRLTTMPDWAKELRIFGLCGFLVDRYATEWSQVMRELWRTRRVGHATMGVLFPAILLANVVVVALAARSALDGDLGAAALTVLVQGMFGMALLAAQDGDVWIENGAVPVPDVLAHERAAATVTPPPARRRARLTACPHARSGSRRCGSAIRAATGRCTTVST